MQVIAFLDRIHGYLSGWEIPKLTPNSYSKDYGFITDYFCEIMHELRRIDLIGQMRSRFELVDLAKTTQGISGRDQRAIMKTASGLLKLLYPDGKVADEELEEVMLMACELRQRVREQLHLIAPGEYDRLKLGVSEYVDFRKTGWTHLARCRPYTESRSAKGAISRGSNWPGSGGRPRVYPPFRDAGNKRQWSNRSSWFYSAGDA